MVLCAMKWLGLPAAGEVAPDLRPERRDRRGGGREYGQQPLDENTAGPGVQVGVRRPGREQDEDRERDQSWHRSLPGKNPE